MNTITKLYTYVNEDDIDAELKCIICDEPFQSPMNCLACGQTYCQQCIERWNRTNPSCPSCRCVNIEFRHVITRIVRNQLGRLVVKCSQCDDGNIQRIYIDEHISQTCPKQIISCADQCGWKGCREHFEQHLVKCRKKRVIWREFNKWWQVNWRHCIGVIFVFLFAAVFKEIRQQSEPLK
jgi:hypothetical protein